MRPRDLLAAAHRGALVVGPVGAMMALKAKFVDGKSNEEALAIGKACGLKALEPAVKEALAK